MKHLTKTAVSMLLVLVLITLMLPVRVSAAEQTFDYYGRDALSELADASTLLYIYDRLVEGVENSDASIDLERSYGITKDQLLTALDAYTRDHTEHFWLGTHYTYSTYPDGVVALNPTYTLSGDALTAAKTAFESAVNEILAGLDDSMSDLEKELYLHDILAARVTYAESNHAHDAYGALVEGVAVCEGYAESLQYLLHRAGIRSFIALGYADGGEHAWNYVEIDDEFYHVDLTWDDQDDTQYHEFFNQTDAVVRETHTIYSAAYALPECDSQDAFYFTGKSAYLDTYTVSDVAKLLRNNNWDVHVYIPGNVDTFKSWWNENVLAIARKAGVTGGFSVSTGYLSREFVLRLISSSTPPQQVATLVYPDGSTADYAFLEDAIADCAAAGGYLQLSADCAANFSVDQNCTLDLNGFDLTGNITGAGTLTLTDSQTDDFTVEDGKGYGKLSGEITASVEPGEGYVKITEADGVSFHKVELTIKSMVLRSEVAGLYFKSIFDGDELVAQHVDGFGVALSVTGVPDETTLENPDFFTRFGKELFGSDADNTSTLLTGIMKPGNGYNTNKYYASMTVYGRTYIEVDGEVTFGQPRSRSLQEQVDGIDNQKWGQLSPTQKQDLLDLYSRFLRVMSEWNIPNIKAS